MQLEFCFLIWWRDWNFIHILPTIVIHVYSVLFVQWILIFGCACWTILIWKYYLTKACFKRICSIYKAVTKANVSINEVNQIAQVLYLSFSIDNLILFCLDKLLFTLRFDYTSVVGGCIQLRVVVTPKPCTGIGPLCTAEQVKV